MDIEELNTIKSRHPDKFFFLHNGYWGWSYGTPQNASFTSDNVALHLLNLLTDEKLLPLRQLESKDTFEYYYAPAGSLLYKWTGGNICLFFGKISDTHNEPEDRKIKTIEVDFIGKQLEFIDTDKVVRTKDEFIYVFNDRIQFTKSGFIKDTQNEKTIYFKTVKVMEFFDSGFLTGQKIHIHLKTGEVLVIKFRWSDTESIYSFQKILGLLNEQKWVSRWEPNFTE